MRVEHQNGHVVVINFFEKVQEQRLKMILQHQRRGETYYTPIRLRVFHDRIEMDVYDGNGRLQHKMLDYVDFFVLNNALNLIFEKRDFKTEDTPLSISISDNKAKMCRALS